ncbi:MAG TPA: zinc transporter ZntB [Gammaproteobacteria bacterium]|jgi:zinc transporter|nr:zinc transporter ZntB [Gammaproteobacteria bacterium]
MKFLHQYYLNGDKTSIQLDRDKAAAPALDGASLWQHLDLNQVESKEWLRNDANIDKLTFQALSAEETRPRSFAAHGGLLVVLRGVNHNPGEDAEDMVSIRVWVEKDRILSARVRKMLAIQDIVDTMNDNTGPRSPGEFLTNLIESLANRIGDFVNRLEDELGEIEDHLETIAPDQMRAQLGSLRRQIASVRRFLAPQRDALDRLYHIDSDILNDRDRQRLREESDRVSRYLEDLDLARERAIVLQEAFLSQLAQQQNSRMYVLSIVAAIFLPLTFVTGLLGMNVGGLPGINNVNGFLIAVVIMFIATGLITLFFKFKKWI